MGVVTTSPGSGADGLERQIEATTAELVAYIRREMRRQTIVMVVAIDAVVLSMALLVFALVLVK